METQGGADHENVNFRFVYRTLVKTGKGYFKILPLKNTKTKPKLIMAILGENVGALYSGVRRRRFLTCVRVLHISSRFLLFFQTCEQNIDRLSILLCQLLLLLFFHIQTCWSVTF